MKNNVLMKNDSVVYDLEKEHARNPPRVKPLSATALEMTALHSPISPSFDGSQYMGSFVPFTDPTLLHPALVCMRNHASVASASHNTYVMKVGKKVHFEDDGEHGAAEKLLPLLNDKADGLLMVSRWFGGKHLGPARFDHMKAAAIEVLEKSPNK